MKVNQKAKRAILNPPVCMEFNHTHFPLFIKFHGYSQYQKKYPFFTEQKSFLKKFCLVKVRSKSSYVLRSSGEEFCGKRNRIMCVLWGHYIVFSSCGCLAPFSFD